MTKAGTKRVYVGGACICICVYMRVNACICMCMHVYACICMYMHVNRYRSVHVCVYSCVCIRCGACGDERRYAASVGGGCMYVYMSVYACTCMFI